MRRLSEQQGQFSIQVLFFTAISVIVITGFLILVLTFVQLSVRNYNKTIAFAIAESGIEYYRWHLAHAPTDYQDGTGQPGPYVHDYFDKNGSKIGQFILEITPPPLGSTIVTVKSTGKVVADPSVSKVIRVKLGIPSFAQYAIVANDFLRFGAGTEVFGPIQSNLGIRFDGIAHNTIKSARSTYDDPDHSGAEEFGVHTHVSPTDPLPPAAVPSRPDVFMAGREFPVATVDFTGITQDLATIKSLAQASGTYFASTTVYGYELSLATSGAYTVYRVATLTAAPSGCTNVLSQSGWGTWSIATRTLYATGTLIDGARMFFEDNLWVKGQIQDKRVTIASGRFPDNPSTRSSITVNDNLLYTNYDGRDVLSLIAQNNINIGMVASTTLRVDGALVAQNGRVGRYYYQGPGFFTNRCSPYHTRSSITSYGMIASNVRYGFAYTDSTGYQTRNLIYDPNLLYGPPPSFPLTTDKYSQISWEELQ